MVVRELAENGLLHAGAITVTGSGAGANAADAPCWNREVIKTVAEPFQPAGTGTGVLRGNLAPGGAVIKQSASSPHLLKHRGRALVFDSPADYYATSNDPDLDADEDTVLVIRYCGPRGYPGMPEVSNVALPRKLLLRAFGTWLRICDGRMSGTAYGTVVLHVSPEARGRRPARLGADRRLDHPGRARTDADAGGQPGRADGQAGAVGAACAARQPGLEPLVHRARAAGRHRRRPGLPRRRERA